MGEAARRWQSGNPFLLFLALYESINNLLSGFAGADFCTCVYIPQDVMKARLSEDIVRIQVYFYQ